MARTRSLNLKKASASTAPAPKPKSPAPAAPSSCAQDALAPLMRVNYFPRQIIDVDDMVTERDYFLQKIRRHNIYLHGSGIVCGLDVTPDPDRGPTWVQIGPGYALGPFGDEINVGSPVWFDLSRCGTGGTMDPCEPNRILSLAAPGAVTGDVYLVIKYAECLTRPVRAMPAGCGCEEEDCQYSRIRDGFQIDCTPEPPPDPDIPSLCDTLHSAVPCPLCATSPWLLLAKVTIPPKVSIAVTEGNPMNQMTIDTSGRRQLYSTAVLQNQIIACCCGEKPVPVPPIEPTPQIRADLEVQLRTKSDPNKPQKEILYVFQVINHGPNDAQGVVLTSKITFQPPQGAIPNITLRTGNFSANPPALWQPQTPSQVLNAGSAAVFSVAIGSIKSGKGFEGRFAVGAANAHAEFVKLQNTATVTSTTPDPDASNNQASRADLLLVVNG